MMLKSNEELIAQLKAVLVGQCYHSKAISNYCRCARRFLDFLERREIQVEDVTQALVSTYISYESGMLRKHHGQSAPYQHPIPRARNPCAAAACAGPVAAPLKAACAAEAVRFESVANTRSGFMRREASPPPASRHLIWEARHFLTWQFERNGDNSLTGLGVDDIGRYMDMRAPKLTRKSLSAVANRLRSLLRHLHRVGRTAIDLSPHVIGPLIYAYEGVPSILERDQVAAVLKAAGKDRTPRGLRDHAILQLLATYGLRSSEICNLRLEDINWRAESIRIRHTKTRACSFLPLMEPVGEAVLDYLRAGRPAIDAREIFIRTRAPYRKLRMLDSVVRPRLRHAGVKPRGESGAHVFRHARAVEMLRASVPTEDHR
ncbi:tyrosine-type recombinase/integrase [Mesorhizobium sp. M1252]|uniref:tyrosine-type recombinase/integrase n=1 Tax=Mesorhizobium sp. M1252 TaxID=2957073 RepID=UPI0033389AB0